MNEHQIRIELRHMLDSHDAFLAAVRTAAAAHDAILVSAIEANRAALRLLTRMMDEGVKGEDEGGDA